MGDIIIELYPDKAPKTVQNFLEYVNSGAYEGTIFHRVINGFMIQGGGLDKNMTPRPTREPIDNESASGLKNQAYSVAMARTEAPHSATSQFFINVKNNTFLDYPGQDGWGYAVFGKVSKGHNVVNKIKAVETASRLGHDDVPVVPVEIIKASVLEDQNQ
jgi:peptidyl-prolyl cis-trans isomerase A (cyclophilin A)/peptidyl-prolyl cis-trans isomerase B (cyclophilin B)